MIDYAAFAERLQRQGVEVFYTIEEKQVKPFKLYEDKMK